MNTWEAIDGKKNTGATVVFLSALIGWLGIGDGFDQVMEIIRDTDSLYVAMIGAGIVGQAVAIAHKIIKLFVR